MAIITVDELDEFAAVLGLTVPDAWTTSRKQTRIDVAQAQLEGLTGRTFDPVSESRRFDGTDGQALPIDDAVEITSVTIGTSATALVEGTDYRAYPLAGSPKTWLERMWTSQSEFSLLADSGVVYTHPIWPAGNGNILIAASWGYCAAGSAVVELKEACAQLAMLHLMAGKVLNIQGGLVGSSLRSITAGGLSVSMATASGGKASVREASGWGDFIDQVVTRHRRKF